MSSSNVGGENPEDFRRLRKTCPQKLEKKQIFWHTVTEHAPTIRGLKPVIVNIDNRDGPAA